MIDQVRRGREKAANEMNLHKLANIDRVIAVLRGFVAKRERDVDFTL